MPALNSSNLASAEYREADTKAGTPAEITVQFKNGRVYSYAGCPREVYDGLLAAESAGKYFNANIRDKYPSSRKA